jgi:hypothetical protein
LYYVLNLVFPDLGTLIPNVIHGDVEVVQGISSSNESSDGDIGGAEKGIKTGEATEVGGNDNKVTERSA